MLSEKYENLLELYVKQLVIQSSLGNSISWVRRCMIVKNQMLMLFVPKPGIFVSKKLSKSK